MRARFTTIAAAGHARAVLERRMRKRDETVRRAARRGSSTRRAARNRRAQPRRRPSPSAAPPAGKGIRLRLEARPGGRAVTLVLGLAGSEADLAALAKALKSVCGAGGTVKDGIIELQGDHRDGAQAALAARGLKARI